VPTLGRYSSEGVASELSGGGRLRPAGRQLPARSVKMWPGTMATSVIPALGRKIESSRPARTA
jgi:hypothetical protein